MRLASTAASFVLVVVATLPLLRGDTTAPRPVSVTFTRTHTKARWPVKVAASEAVDIQVTPATGELEFAIKAAGGRKLVDLVIPSVALSQWTWTFVAEQAGSYTIEASRSEATPLPHKFALSIKPGRPASAADRTRVELQNALTKAILLAASDEAEKRRQAVVEFTRTRKLAQEAGDRVLEFCALDGLGLIHNALGERELALAAHSDSLSVAQTLKESRLEATALLEIGSAQDVLGRPEESRRSIELALGLFRQAGDAIGQARALKHMGDLLETLGQKKLAIENYEAAYQMYIEANDTLGSARVLSGIGVAYYSMGEIPTALDYYQRAHRVFSQFHDTYSTAVNLLNIGVGYEQIGDFPRSLSYLRRALKLAKQLGDNQTAAYALHGFGAVYRKAGQYKQALAAMTQAKAKFGSVGDDRGESTALNNIGRVHLLMGQPQLAMAAHREALDRFRRAKNLTGQAYARSNIGEVLQARKQHDAALVELRAALDLFRQVPDPSGEAYTLHRFAMVERDRGNLEAASSHIDSALEVIDSLRARLLNADQRSSYFANVHDIHSFRIDLLMQRAGADAKSPFAAQAFEASERARSRSLLESIPALGEGVRVDSDLLKKEQAILKRIRDDLSAGKKLPAESLTEYEELKAEIARRSPHYGALKNPRTLTLAEVVQEVLDTDTTLVEYWLGEKRSFAWIVSREGLRSVQLPPQAAIVRASERLVQGVRSMERGVVVDTDAAAAALGRMVIAPIVKHVRTPRLLLSPDGVLHSVPFAALPVPSGQTGRVPLVARFELVSAPSASVVAAIRERRRSLPRANKTMAVFADPVYEPSDERIVNRPGLLAHATPGPAATLPVQLVRAVRSSAPRLRGGVLFERLGGSAREAAAIVNIAAPNNVQLFEGLSVTRERASDAQLAQYRILHFATHAVLNSEQPEFSGLVLSLYDREGKPTDGYFRLLDIYNLQLGADLVVLSACQTAVGKELKGEGLISVTRGFLHAGAARVAATLWQVRDASTPELVKHFYAALLGTRRLSPAAALREAQNTIRQQPIWQSPYHWAGFVLQGDWQQ